jgi:hypothetical protein
MVRIVAYEFGTHLVHSIDYYLHKLQKQDQHDVMILFS